MRLDELIDPRELLEQIASGYVGYQRHPTEPLKIFNYTKKCQYDGAWNDVTRQCRGLIAHDDGTVVARPWPKFHNYGEHDTEGWDPTEYVYVTDKMDGSLGILYPTSEGHAIATRGSFTSDQARFATRYWREHHEGWIPYEKWTFLFEIIYPGNRVIVDYGTREDLVLLGAVLTSTGETIESFMTGFPGSRVPNFGYMTLRDALELEPRPNAEGVVLRFTRRRPELLVKVKQDDYIALHRIITGLNEKHVWERLAVGTWKDKIKEPMHWGSYLGIDPAEVPYYVATDHDWREKIPEEFHEWLETTEDKIRIDVSGLVTSALNLIGEIKGMERKDQYQHVKHHPCVTEIMRMANGESVADEMGMKAWRSSRPETFKAVFDREEDVA